MLRTLEIRHYGPVSDVCQTYVRDQYLMSPQRNKKALAKMADLPKICKDDSIIRNLG